MILTEFMQSAVQYGHLIIKRLGRVPLILLFVWVAAIWWGERSVFSNSIESCRWDQWETWDSNARPHHVLLVADPQLVDPHTYPGRPWPLSTLTILYTDLYLKRSYRYLLDQLEPDSTLFLGDLFDGGREWGSTKYKSPEQRYKKYGMNFWLREYHRFMSIFIDGWTESTMHEYPNEGGRRIITSLPGNHDLGFAGGINSRVKSRFDTHFGPMNRIDMMGNHTFISLDTVSLSAMDEVDPATGSSGAGDGSAKVTKMSSIWRPVEDFLRDAHALRDQAARHYVRMLDSFKQTPEVKARDSKFASTWYEAGNVAQEERTIPDSLHVSTNQLPTIVLSHVPLYRGEGADCGPLRERGRSLLLQGGYQYQNVLTPLISKDIIDHLDAGQITQIYSGDDHDYCELEHDEFSGRIKEITVKSMSWAMGVRKPGVQLASLWNPIDLDQITTKPTGTAEDISPAMPRKTVQNHLCLLPDQLAIFIRYGQLLGLTLFVLLIRAIRYKFETDEDMRSSYSPIGKEKGNEPLLPITRKITPPGSPDLDQQQYSQPHHLSSLSISSSTNTNNHHQSFTSNRVTTTTQKGLGGYGNLPVTSRSASPFKNNDTTHHDDSDDWGMPLYQQPNMTHAYRASNLTGTGTTHRSRFSNTHLRFFLLRKPSSKLTELIRSITLIACPVLSWYLFLIWRG